MKNSQGNNLPGPSGAPASGSASTTPVRHTQYRVISQKNSKCDVCNQRNTSTIQRCMQCTFTTCSACHAQGRYDLPLHNLTGLNLDWTAPPRGGRGRGRGRGNAAAASAPSSQRRPGLIRQYAAENQQDDGSVERISGGRPSAAPVPAAPALAAPAPVPAAPDTVPVAPVVPIVTPVAAAPPAAAAVAPRTPRPWMTARKREYRPLTILEPLPPMPSYMANKTSGAPEKPNAPVAPMTVEAASHAAATAVPEVVPRDEDEEDALMADEPAAPAPADNSGSAAVPPRPAVSTLGPDELFNLMLGEWTGGATADVRREEGPLPALDRLEMATILLAMLRNMPFPPQCEAWLRRQRRYFRSE
ncbi:hypothetical protein PG993_000489 [Apiospora rasikravindrae]|uniref:Uncharacterized protein n=1 Tax=Apiospora rasikravindrae TaxID=990691 RepID=A0ABR1U8Q1_9PEZI